MKFIVSSTYLLKQLQVLGGVINNSNTLPISGQFFVRSSEEQTDGLSFRPGDNNEFYHPGG